MEVLCDNEIAIRRVTGRKDLEAFVEFRRDLYRHCPYAVPYLSFDEMDTLRKDRNAAFDYSEAEYFLALHDGAVVGRIAGIINHRANERWNRRTVRFGWIDFIDDIRVSRALLQAVEDWGRSKGMTEMVGPMGFTDMDREGMLIEGFDRLATMYSTYNYAYYPEHIKRLGGFTKDNDYLEYRVKIPERLPEKFAHVASVIEQRYNLHARNLTRREILHEGYGHKIFEVLNITYRDLYGFAELTGREIDQFINGYIKIADLKMISVVEDWNAGHKLVGFGITFPSLSKALQRSGGRLLPFGWLRMLRVIKCHHTDVVDLLLIGVLPEYRAKGVNALIFRDLVDRFQQYHIKYAEAMQQMETNDNVRNLWQYFDSEQHKRHRCYIRKIE